MTQSHSVVDLCLCCGEAFITWFMFGSQLLSNALQGYSFILTFDNYYFSELICKRNKILLCLCDKRLHLIVFHYTIIWPRFLRYNFSSPLFLYYTVQHFPPRWKISGTNWLNTFCEDELCTKSTSNFHKSYLIALLLGSLS